MVCGGAIFERFFTTSTPPHFTTVKIMTKKKTTVVKHAGRVPLVRAVLDGFGIAPPGSANAGTLAKNDALLPAAGARPCDIVSISLYGAAAPTLTLDTTSLENSGRFFHVNIDRSRVRPDYDLDALAGESATSLKSEFVRRMLDMERAAQDEDERRALRDAVYYGLHALDGRKLEPVDAD